LRRRRRVSPKARREFVVGVLAALRPPSDLKVSKWSEKRKLSSEASAIPGYFVPFPYQVEPMDSVLETNVSETVFMWAAQTAKSETMNCIAGYFMEEEPAPQLMAQPTIDLAKEYSKDRIATMIRDSPTLRPLVRDPRSRDSGNTILSKRYPGGSFILTGANSPAGLAGRPRRVILQDEIDRFPASAGTEGDPVALADKRAESFPNAVKVKGSTPTIKGVSRIEKLMEQSDYRKWHVCCPKCKGEQVFMWEQVRFSFPDPEAPTDPKKNIIDPERAYIECTHCKAELSDGDREAMVKGGKWKATQPFTGVRGYWLNGLNTLFKAHKGFKNRIHEFAAEFLKAKKDGRQALKVWMNTFLCETWEEEGETVDSQILFERREDYLETPPDGRPVLPKEILALTAGVDVQASPARIEAEIVGWGADGESWGVQYLIIEKRTTWRDTFDELDRLLLKPWKHELGFELAPASVCVDTGHETEECYKYVKRCWPRRVHAVKGSSEGYAEPLVGRPRKSGVKAVSLYMIGTITAKAELYSRLRLTEAGPGMQHFPKDEARGYDVEFFRQLTSEKLVTKHSGGRKTIKFVKPEGRRNEALDIRCYAMAALALLNPDFTAIAAKIKAQLEEEGRDDEPEGNGTPDDPPPPEPPPAPKLNTYEIPKAEPEPVKPAQQVRRAPRRNFATSW
jgi:phage terminase large subunit GpA-like protein